jgi:hypothetical protein
MSATGNNEKTNANANANDTSITDANANTNTDLTTDANANTNTNTNTTTDLTTDANANTDLTTDANANANTDLTTDANTTTNATTDANDILVDGNNNQTVNSGIQQAAEPINTVTAEPINTVTAEPINTVTAEPIKTVAAEPIDEKNLPEPSAPPQQPSIDPKKFENLLNAVANQSFNDLTLLKKIIDKYPELTNNPEKWGKMTPLINNLLGVYKDNKIIENIDEKNEVADKTFENLIFGTFVLAPFFVGGKKRKTKKSKKGKRPIYKKSKKHR